MSSAGFLVRNQLPIPLFLPLNPQMPTLSSETQRNSDQLSEVGAGGEAVVWMLVEVASGVPEPEAVIYSSASTKRFQEQTYFEHSMLSQPIDSYR